MTNQFVSTPVCCPSRGGMLTGRYIHNIPMTNNTLSGNCASVAWREGAEKESIGVRMQRLGYMTLCVIILHPCLRVYCNPDLETPVQFSSPQLWWQIPQPIWDGCGRGSIRCPTGMGRMARLGRELKVLQLHALHQWCCGRSWRRLCLRLLDRPSLESDICIFARLLGPCSIETAFFLHRGRPSMPRATRTRPAVRTGLDQHALCGCA